MKKFFKNFYSKYKIIFEKRDDDDDELCGNSDPLVFFKRIVPNYAENEKKKSYLNEEEEVDVD